MTVDQSLSDLASAEVLTDADQHVASRISRLTGEVNEQVVLACALVVAATRDGSVCLDLKQVRSTLRIPDEISLPAADEWQAAVAISPAVSTDGSTPMVRWDSRLYLNRYWQHEVRLANAIAARSADVGDEIEDGDAEPLTDNPDLQQVAVEFAESRQLSIVAGGPGTGKTTTITQIFARLTSVLGQDGRVPAIALAAPTGRAAARLQQALLDACSESATVKIDVDERLREAVTEARPSTLHRLLGWQPRNQSRFKHDRHNPLPFDAVIVDECSMISLAHMDQLFDAVAPATKLVLVGDPQQLASVDAGSVFGDIVAAGGDEPRRSGVVVLRQGHRFGPEIDAIAQLILEGDSVALIDRLAASSGDVVRWIEHDAAGLSTGQISSALQAAMPGWQSLSDFAQHRETVSSAAVAVDQSRILCAHRLGRHGAAEWNAYVMAALATDYLTEHDPGRWYVGRPVLVGENDYTLDVYNGDTGVVVPGPDGVPSVAFARANKIFEVNPDRLGGIETAYASTVHKAQGSQFDSVVVVMPPGESRLINRELFYTAVTRARGSVTIVGSAESIAAALERRGQRASGLADRLKTPSVATAFTPAI